MLKLISKIFTVVAAVGMFATGTAFAKKANYSFAFKCKETNGTYRFEIGNSTASSVSYSISKTSGSGTAVSGACYAEGEGDGATEDDTRTWVSSSGTWKITIGSESYSVATKETACTAETRFTLCHVPPGNPQNAHTITVGSTNARDKHYSQHGDYAGSCNSTASSGGGSTSGGSTTGGSPSSSLDGCDLASNLSSCASSGLVF